MTATAPESVQLEDIYRQMEIRFTENLKQFEKWLPEGYKQIAKHAWDHTSVDISDRGLTLVYQGQSYYPQDPWEYSSNQVDSFIQKPEYYSIGINPPEKTSHFLQDKYLWKMFDAAGRETGLRNYTYDQKNTPVLMCFGIASGFHLEILLEKLSLQHLIIYEADIELLLSSFYCIDWGPIFVYFAAPNRRLDLLLGDDIEDVTDDTVRKIRTHSTPFCTQNYMFHHVESEFYKKLEERLREKLIVVIQGFGFYDDERVGLEHTIGNVVNQQPLLSKPLKRKNQLPVFIVGAGSSLQDDIEFIKAHKEQAIIFSCGSGIGALLSQGITPDFHLEKERIVEVDLSLEKLNQDDSLKKIHYIALNVVNPATTSRFASCSMMLKSDDFPASLFPPNFPTTKSVQPMAANFGITCAIHLEFKDIYLFGVDMGMRDPDNHHALGTVHDEDKFRNLVLYRAPAAYDANIETDGNHGGTILTNACYLWGVHSVETAAIAYKKGKIINASDGAHMKNTVSVTSADIELPPRKTSKKEMIERILGCFGQHNFGIDEFSNSLEITYKQVTEICNHVNKIASIPIKNHSELVSTLSSIRASIFQPAHYLPTQYLLGATLRVPLTYIYAISTSESDTKQSIKIANACLSILQEYINAVVENLGDLIKTHKPN